MNSEGKCHMEGYNMAERDYHIDKQGHRWRLSLLVDGLELGRGVFDDHDSALAVGSVWLSDDEADIETVLASVS